MVTAISVVAVAALGFLVLAAVVVDPREPDTFSFELRLVNPVTRLPLHARVTVIKVLDHLAFRYNADREPTDEEQRVIDIGIQLKLKERYGLDYGSSPPTRFKADEEGEARVRQWLGGRCRRFPPSFYGAGAGLVDSEFPLVAARNWCGEFRATEENAARASRCEMLRKALEHAELRLHSIQNLVPCTNQSDLKAVQNAVHKLVVEEQAAIAAVLRATHELPAKPPSTPPEGDQAGLGESPNPANDNAKDKDI